MSSQVKLIPMNAPESIFDVEGAVIYRRKRVPVWRVDELRTSETPEEVYSRLANLVPRWEGVVDCETGEPLANPEDDPSVFGHLDSREQMPWISAQLGVRRDPNGSTSPQGQN